MAVTYRINEGKKDHVKIYVRFRERGIDVEAPTPILINKNHWNPAKQQLRNVADAESRATINQDLIDLESRIISQFNEDNKKGGLFNSTWLKDVIASYFNKETSTTKDHEIYLSAYGDVFCEKAHTKRNKRTGKPLDKRTVQDYVNANNKLKAFENASKKRIRLDQANLKFHNDFVEYLRTVELLGENTIGGVIDVIKAMIKSADVSEIKVHPAYRSGEFYSPAFKPKDIYLNEEELEIIFKHNFPVDGYLDNARDWLIISCWTGLRVSDVLSITSKDIKNGFIDNINRKTEIMVNIPLHPMVRKILEKRGGEFPRQIEEQNYNKYIKQVVKDAGFEEIVDGAKMVSIKGPNGETMSRKKEGKYPKWELVTTHIGRRSFASNMYGKIDSLTIMKITGHQTEKQFLAYIKIPERIHAQRLADHWKEFYNEKSPE